jgi:hypothetical protein
MKSLTGALVALAIGAVLGAGVVAGIAAYADPDRTVNTSNGEPINVLPYGNRS